jgi:hypothetical protein
MKLDTKDEGPSPSISGEGPSLSGREDPVGQFFMADQRASITFSLRTPSEVFSTKK